MLCGFFSSDISPVAGSVLPHYESCYRTDGIHDRLQANAAVFDDGSKTVALAGIDMGFIPRDYVELARKKIHALCGIDEQNIMIAASHTHTGPTHTFIEKMDEIFADAPDDIKSLLYDYGVADDKIYKEQCCRQIAEAVYNAWMNRKEADISIGSGIEDKCSFNRVFQLKDGRTYTHPGKCNPAIVEAFGIDPEVGVVAAWREDGSLLGCIVNFGCHGTTLGGREASADWICYLRELIKNAMGKDAGVVFLNGACGDVTQIDNQTMNEIELGEKYARKVGYRVGAEAIKVMASTERGDVGLVNALSRTLRIPRRESNPAKLAEALEIVKYRPEPGKPNKSQWLFARERVLFDYLRKVQPEKEIELQAIQIGPAVFLSNPAEYFHAGALAIKKQSKFPYTFVVELANGACGYVADSALFDEKTGGGYETALTSLSNMIPAAFDIIRDESITLSQQLTPVAALKTPQVEGPGAIWGYGLLGPDRD